MHSKNSKKSWIVNSVGEKYYGCYYRSLYKEVNVADAATQVR